MTRGSLSPARTIDGNRIDTLFQSLENRAALILYITAGHPDIEASLRLVPLVAEMSDIIEIGIPFSDPVADGPIIQASSQTALKSGTNIQTCLQLVRGIRRQHETPVVLFTYYNPVLQYGLAQFARDARAAGADAVLCVDLPPEEASQLHEACVAEGLYVIPLVTPTSTPERLARACDIAGGFVYCVSRTGVTGMRDTMNTELPQFLQRVRACTDLPRAVGFGVSTPEQAGLVAAQAEGVVIGSALVDIISRRSPEHVDTEIEAFVEGIRKGMMDG